MLSDRIKYFQQHLLPKTQLTRLAGVFANTKTKSLKNWLIQHFIKQYGVNMEEALEEDPRAYETFNQFFIRHLKPDRRPIAAAQVVSPIDGSVSEIGSIAKGQLLQAKGWYYSVQALLGCPPEISNTFKNGLFATFYLSPKDYHRVHMPTKGRLQRMFHIPGKLFSVQPASVRTIPQLFSRNERAVMLFETQFGPMAVIFVGATIVGRIGTTVQGELSHNKQIRAYDYTTPDKTKQFLKGEELGYFKLGSTVIVLFSNQNSIKWLEHIQAGDAIRLGEALTR